MTAVSGWRDVWRFPWRQAAAVLRERLREDRLGLAAGSLTFTTSIALVPLVTVALALLTAFPMFAKLQGALQAWLVDSLMPENISRQVLGSLTQFTRQASRLGVAGLVVLAITAVAMMLTIDRTLNAIWRVRQSRPLTQRLLVYWAALTLGPVLLAASLAATSYVMPWVRGGGVLPPAVVRWGIDALEFLVMSGAMAALFHYMPNTFVRWRHAWAGGLFVAAGLLVAKQVLALYLRSVPTYSVVYGAFATVPILLVWIYMAWVIVLSGAVITASLPQWLAGTGRQAQGPGADLSLALQVLRHLQQARTMPERGLSADGLVQELRCDRLALDGALQVLAELRWAAPLATAQADVAPVHVLLVDPATTPLAPLIERILLERSAATEHLWRAARWEGTPLGAVL